MRSLGAARGRYEAAPLALSRRFSLAPTAPFSFSLGQRHRGAEADISPSSAAICAVAAASPPPGPGHRAWGHGRYNGQSGAWQGHVESIDESA